MLIAYNDLLQLPAETLNNLIREYLLTQVEDGSFVELNQSTQQAISRCKQLLKQGLLVVEYSEDDESIAIRHAEHLNY